MWPFKKKTKIPTAETLKKLILEKQIKNEAKEKQRIENEINESREYLAKYFSEANHPFSNIKQCVYLDSGYFNPIDENILEKLRAELEYLGYKLEKNIMTWVPGSISINLIDLPENDQTEYLKKYTQTLEYTVISMKE